METPFVVNPLTIINRFTDEKLRKFEEQRIKITDNSDPSTVVDLETIELDPEDIINIRRRVREVIHKYPRKISKDERRICS